MLKIIFTNYAFQEEKLIMTLHLQDGGGFTSNCGIVKDGVSAAITWWDFNVEANIAFITAEFPAPLLPGTMTITCDNGVINTEITPAIPSLFYSDADIAYSRNADSKNVWALLGDFWRLFEDHKIVENIWGGYIVTFNELYRLLDHVDKSNFINEIEPLWLSNFALFGPVDKTVRLDDFDPKMHPVLKEFNQYFAVDSSFLQLPTLFKFAYRYSYPGQDSDINAFVNANDSILHTDTEYNDSVQLVDGRDYILYNGALLFRNDLVLKGYYWAPWAYIETEAISRNFGYFYEARDESSANFYLKVKSLWMAMWKGPTVQSFVDGLNMLMGGSFITTEAIVTSVIPIGSAWQIILDTGLTLTTDVEPLVRRGDKVQPYQALSKTCEIIDRVNDYEWFYALIDRNKMDTNTFDTGGRLTLDKWYRLGDSTNHLKYHKFRVNLNIHNNYVSDDDLRFARYFIQTLKPAHTAFDIEAAFDLADGLFEASGGAPPPDEFETECGLWGTEILKTDFCMDTDLKLSVFRSNFTITPMAVL